MSIGVNAVIASQGLWTPAAIPNLFEWWLAAPAYVAYDGSNRVSSWTGAYAGRVASQGTVANQPIWSSSDSDCNNQPSITFDGSNDSLDDAGPASDWGWWVRTDSPGGCTDIFAMVVARHDAATTSNRRVFGAENGFSNSTYLFDGAASGSASMTFTQQGRRAGGGIASGITSTIATQTLFWFASSIPCATSGTAYSVGTNRTWTSLAFTCPANTTNPTNALRLGTQTNGAGTYWSGPICEIIVAKTPLTSALAAQLQSYVTLRYGL